MSRVLVVDDDPIVRQLVELRLSRAGHDVHTVSDGATALERVSDLDPDVIVLDWMLPRLTGPEVCRRLRQAPRTSRARVMLLSGRAGEHDVEHGFECGADDFVAKPFSLGELESRVRALAGRYE